MPEGGFSSTVGIGIGAAEEIVEERGLAPLGFVRRRAGFARIRSTSGLGGLFLNETWLAFFDLEGVIAIGEVGLATSAGSEGAGEDFPDLGDDSAVDGVAKRLASGGEAKALRFPRDLDLGGLGGGNVAPKRPRAPGGRSYMEEERYRLCPWGLIVRGTALAG